MKQTRTCNHASCLRVGVVETQGTPFHIARSAGGLGYKQGPSRNVPFPSVTQREHTVKRSFRDKRQTIGERWTKVTFQLGDTAMPVLGIEIWFCGKNPWRLRGRRYRNRGSVQGRAVSKRILEPVSLRKTGKYRWPSVDRRRPGRPFAPRRNSR